MPRAPRNPILIAAALFSLLAPPILTGADLVEIEGLSSISAAEAEEWLTTQLEFVESSGVSMARADDLAFFLENSLRDRGYKSATVDWKLTGESESKKIVLTVDEGRPQVVGTVVPQGNSAVESEAIRELLLAGTRKRLGLKLDDPAPYVAADLQKGRKRILEIYHLLGFADAEIRMETSTSAGGINLAVNVSEGPRYKVGEIQLPKAADSKMEEAFADLLSEFSGKNYSSTVPRNLKTRILELAVESGFYNAEVEVLKLEEAGTRASSTGGEPIRGIGGGGPSSELTATPVEESLGEDREVNLVASADWGDPVIIDSVQVRGNQKVKDRFFDRHFGAIEGAAYSPNQTNAEVNELLKTGAFETVRTDLVEQPDGTTALEVEVEESYSRTLGVYGGFATYEGPIGGFEFQNLNLLGSVRRIDATVEFSRRSARGEIDYTDPWFLWSSYELNAGLFAINRIEEGYQRFSTGGRYSLTRKFGEKERNRITFFGEAAYTDVHDSDIATVFLGDRTYFAHLTGLSFAHDHRDSPVTPRRGWIAQGSAGLASSALGSEVEYFKAAGGLAFYAPVNAHTFRMRARSGVIKPIGDQRELPIDLRFFNGGANSVRSFEERRLGAFDPSSGYPIGGEFFTVISTEYDIPIKAIEGLSVVPFFDAGNLIPMASDASFDGLRYAIGLGLHYLTPIGPLRIEYGHNPNPAPSEADGTVHIGFGSAF